MIQDGDIRLRGQTKIGTIETSANVRVWDLGIRIFHWGLVVAFLGAGVSEWVLPESFLDAHLLLGYTIGGLLLFRLVWGCFGSEYGRLSHLRATPRQAVRYVLDFLQRHAQPYLGHNPGGALMIVVLLGTLFGVVITGMLVQAGEEKQGPFAGFVSYAVGSAARDIHSLLVNSTLVLIGFHVLAVILHRALAGESLVSAMITGRKSWHAPTPVLALRGAALLPAALTIAIIAGVCAWIVRAGERVPPLGVPVLPVSETYRSDCGACHDPFHPSLLPRSSWQSLMAGLDNHFGEDASLPPAEAAEITRYLTANSAETWDTEAGRRIAKVSPADPLRITASPHWQRKHHWLPASAFTAETVKTKSHCSACHSDAETGGFADQAITYDQGVFR
ncbi:MAG: cytochrome b/b6 domain-containing protein [Stellaceae bacterium]